MSKYFFDKKIIFRVIVGIIALTIAINAFGAACDWRGYDETKFYEEFAEFKDFTSLTELTEYCDDNKLEYIIKDSKITVNKFDATFVIAEDTITPDFNSNLLCYEQLDNEDMTKVKMSAEKIGLKIKYVYTVSDLTNTYTKIDGEFYRMPILAGMLYYSLAFAAIIVVILLTAFAVYMRVIDIKEGCRKRNPLSDILS